MFQAIRRVFTKPSYIGAGKAARVDGWLRKQSMRVGASPMLWPGMWQVVDDADGSVLLIPLCDTDPGLAIMPCAAGYEVLVCDPEDMDEIGPFDTIEDSLEGIARWFALPCRSFDMPSPSARSQASALRPQ